MEKRKNEEARRVRDPGLATSLLRGWRLWLIIACVVLPLLGFGLAGVLWLHDHNWLSWAGLVFLCGEACALILFRRWARGGKAVLPQPGVKMPAEFSPREEGAWALVQEYQARVERGEIILAGAEGLLPLGREILERIAHYYHPTDQDPLRAVPIPLLFRAIEETARDLADVSASLPLSHKITISDLTRGYRLQQRIKPVYDTYRLFYPLLNWKSAAFQYLITDRLFDLTKETLSQWLLKWYIDRVGYHAIELYSGKLLLTRRREHLLQMTAETSTLVGKAEQQTPEPLRILVLGQVKAGKSSLINAMFGEVRAATDVVPTTARVTPYVLNRTELGGGVLISDMGGYEDPSLPAARRQEALAEALRSDVVLLVVSATNAAREPDRMLLHHLREYFASQPELLPTLVIVVLSHIDLLRPVREWNPPYNVAKPDSVKAQTMRAAMDAVGADLEIEPELIIPVCLLPDREYNVEEALMPLLVSVLPEAKRSLLLRSLKTFREQEQWELFGQQARAAGRFVWQFGGAILRRGVDRVLKEQRL
ncbi:MAG: GTPase [Candidatus Binatia bacterium]